MNSLEKELRQRALHSGDMDFQGFQMQVVSKGKLIINLKVGKTYPFYDFASLTKILFTVPWFMREYQCNKNILHKAVSEFIPWYPAKTVKVGELLNHSAGNTWWEPFYKKISGSLPPEQAFQQMERLCREAPREKKVARAVYSDIDFYLLGSIMQKVEAKPLQAIWMELKNQFYPCSHLHFNYGNKPLHPRKQYAPTEKCSWRGKVLQGEVHDENCWALGGMAPHAGLFGKIEDLTSYGFFLRQILRSKASVLRTSTLKNFSKRSLPKTKGDWGYGFMLPSQKGSSAGDLLSKNSFGHTGFTGNSFWFDSQRDLFVSLLSNRVHPTRENKGFIRLRPKIHNWIIELTEGKK